MNAELKQAKQNIRPYLRQITDQQLAVLMAMAQDGKVEYMDQCSCILGIVGGCTKAGYKEQSTKIGDAAEYGLLMIGGGVCRIFSPLSDPLRNRRLYPMCKAEQRRRDRVRSAQEEQADGGQSDPVCTRSEFVKA